MLKIKNIIGGVFVFVALMPCAAQAAQGDVVGNIYATDIKTYAFGKEIAAYNIGGETVIPCEDLIYFGMEVVWNNDTRMLTVNDKRDPYEYRENDVQRELSNDYLLDLGNYHYIYESDIEVVFNDSLIRAYALDGKMGVIAEDLRNYGYDVIWDSDARTLSIEQKGNISMETDLGAIYLLDKMDWYTSKSKIEFRRTYFTKADGTEFILPSLNAFLYTHYDGYEYSISLFPAKELCKELNIDISIDNGRISFVSTNADDLAHVRQAESCLPDGTIVTNNAIDMEYKDIYYPYFTSIKVNGVNEDLIYSHYYSDTLLHPQGELEETKETMLIFNNVLYVPFDLISVSCLQSDIQVN